MMDRVEWREYSSVEHQARYQAGSAELSGKWKEEGVEEVRKIRLCLPPLTDWLRLWSQQVSAAANSLETLNKEDRED